MWPDATDGIIPDGSGERNKCAEQRGRDRSDPWKEHKRVPGWMRIQWACATGLLAARWGRSRG